MIDKISIQQYRDHIATSTNIMSRAMGSALMRLGGIAELEAQRNIQNKFGRPDTFARWGYTVSGALAGSIYHRFAKDGNELSLFVGSRGIIYARIHEKGGQIIPKNWKFLWQRLPATNKKGGYYHRLQPSDFYQAQKNAPALSGFFYYKNEKGHLIAAVDEMKNRGLKRGKSKITPLFWLRKNVKIKPRPYLLPAIKKVKSLYHLYYMQELSKWMGKK